MLEYQIGRIEADIAPSAWAQTRWEGVLATYTVTTTIDVVGATLQPGSLRWAIQQANANPGLDTIVFVLDGTFNLAPFSSGGDDNIDGDFDITDSVNIVGKGSANTIINGNGVDRVFDLRTGTITLSGLTIQGGRSNEGAGVRIESGATVTMNNVVIQDNRGNGSSKGGGIYVDGTLTITNSIVQRNGDNLVGNVDGGGIYVDSDARLTARNVELRDNVANDKDGGAIYHKGAGLTLENVTLAGNLAKRGGGLFIDGSASDPSTLTNGTVSGNTATSEGGGLWVDDTAHARPCDGGRQHARRPAAASTTRQRPIRQRAHGKLALRRQQRRQFQQHRLLARLQPQRQLQPRPYRLQRQEQHTGRPAGAGRQRRLHTHPCHRQHQCGA